MGVLWIGRTNEGLPPCQRSRPLYALARFRACPGRSVPDCQDRVVYLPRRASLSLGHLLDDLPQRIPPERSPTGQQLVKDYAQAEDVRTPIDEVPLTSGLLGTHIRWCSSQSHTLAIVLVSEGKSEIGETRFA